MYDTEVAEGLLQHEGFELIHPGEDVDFVPPTSAGLDIQFRIDPSLLPNPELERALAEAAGIVESLFFDPITVVIDIKFGDSDSLAFADPVLFTRPYVETTKLLQDDAAADERLVFDLPPLDMTFRLPESFSLGEVTITRANLLALGFSPAQLTAGETSEFDPSVKRDAQIRFHMAAFSRSIT